MRRHLGAFGPATATDIQVWSGLSGIAAVIEGMRDEPRVKHGRRKLFDLPGAPLPDEDVPAPPRLLPEFDSLMLAHKDRTRVITDEQRKSLATKNLRVKPTFLVDGFAAGSWSMARKRDTATLTIAPFEKLPGAPVAGELAAEGEALLRFVEEDAAKHRVEFSRDIEQLVAGLVVDLQRRVVEPEALASSCSSSRRRAWQSSPGRTSTWAASAGKPDVTSQTCRSWTSTTPGCAGERVADRPRVDPARRALEQHAARLAQQAPGRAHHQHGDEQRGDRVGLAEARRRARRARERRAERRVEVGQHVGARALDVERAPLGARQRPRGRDVDHRADEADDEHDAALDVRRVAAAAGRLDAITPAEHEQRRAVDLRGEDLRTAEPEREAAARRPRRQPRGDQRERRARRRR